MTKCKLDILHESIHLVVMWLLYIPAPLATCQYQSITWTFLHSHPTPIHALMLQGRDLQEFELKHTHIFGYFLGSLVLMYNEKKWLHSKSALDEFTFRKMTITWISIYFSPSASIKITSTRCTFRKWLEMFFAEHLNIMQKKLLREPHKEM